MKYLFFLLFMFCSLLTQAQSKDLQAKAAYMLAEESYGKGEYQSAINYLKTASENLGAPNSKILFLQIQAYAELYKTNKAFQQQLLGSIESFQAARDVKNFNEDKVLEVVKMKMALKNEIEKELAAKKAKEQQEQKKTKRFEDYSYPNWPLGVTLEELAVMNKDSVFFQGKVKDKKQNGSQYTKHHQGGISFHPFYNIPETKIGNHVFAAFTNNDGRVVSYLKQIYYKSSKLKDSGFEVSRAEILRMIARQSELLGPPNIKGRAPGQTTGNYYWMHNTKEIAWYVLLIPGKQWYTTIVEEVFKP